MEDKVMEVNANPPRNRAAIKVAKLGAREEATAEITYKAAMICKVILRPNKLLAYPANGRATITPKAEELTAIPNSKSERENS